jgi:excisionase family DNA binding protein
VSQRLEAALAELAAALLEELRASPPASPLPDRLLSIEEAAQQLGIGRTLMYSELRSGRLASVKLGRRRLVPRAALGRYTSGENHVDL